jgi:hypothetical protein
MGSCCPVQGNRRVGGQPGLGPLGGVVVVPDDLAVPPGLELGVGGVFGPRC